MKHIHLGNPSTSLMDSDLIVDPLPKTGPSEPVRSLARPVPKVSEGLFPMMFGPFCALFDPWVEDFCKEEAKARTWETNVDGRVVFHGF